MPTVRTDKARALCSAAEYKLVRQSAPQHISSLSAAQLRNAATRARNLRDKQRDLAQRQRREMRGKADPRKKGGHGNPATNNANTLIKFDIFQLALDRFQARLDKVESGHAGSASTKDKKSKRKGKAALTAIAKKAAAKSVKSAKSAKPANKATASPKNGAKTAKSIKKKSTPVLTSSGKPKAKALFARAGSLGGGTDSSSSVMAARTTAMLAVSEQSAPSRHANILANTANTRIRGHALGSHRRAQAKRDAVQRIGRNPDVKPGRKEP